jgi:hypothetical protein
MSVLAGILLSTINAKWIHPSLALRLLKANLGGLEEQCGILEFALRQPLEEKVDPILAARPRIFGLSVSIWNHAATLELLKALEKKWRAGDTERPLVISLLAGGSPEKFIDAPPVDPVAIDPAYRLYTGEDLRQKLIYVEASRGCPFGCEFCLSAVKRPSEPAVRYFPLEPFLKNMEILIRRGVKTFKFLDRTFNLDISRARRIMEFFIERLSPPNVSILRWFPPGFPRT